MATEVET